MPKSILLILVHATVKVTLGDNILTGPKFSASLERGKLPYYDGLVFKPIKYEALCLGNHEFDFGPYVTANLIKSTVENTIFVSANLDFSNEPGMKELKDEGLIAKSVVVNRYEQKIGIVGAISYGGTRWRQQPS